MRTALELLAIGAGGAGAVVAAQGFLVWIALTSGVSTAALAYLGSLRADNSIVAYNRAATRLTGLRRGWMAESPREREAGAFARLVAETESTLMHEHAGWMHQMSEALHELQASQERAAR